MPHVYYSFTLVIYSGSTAVCRGLVSPEKMATRSNILQTRTNCCSVAPLVNSLTRLHCLHCTSLPHTTCLLRSSHITDKNGKENDLGETASYNAIAPSALG